MKRKVGNPDIQKKKLNQVKQKTMEQDLKEELKEERMLYPKKRRKEPK